MKSKYLASQNELLTMPVCESPRLKWLKKHNIEIEKTDHQCGEEDEFGNDLWPVYVGDGKTMFGAPTEDEALVKFAQFKGIRLWNEECL